MSTFLGYFKGVEIAFDKGDVFRDEDEIVVRNAKNVSDFTDEILPHSIPLNQIEMDITKRAYIIMYA